MRYGALRYVYLNLVSLFGIVQLICRCQKIKGNTKGTVNIVSIRTFRPNLAIFTRRVLSKESFIAE